MTVKTMKLGCSCKTWELSAKHELESKSGVEKNGTNNKFSAVSPERRPNGIVVSILLLKFLQGTDPKYFTQFKWIMMPALQTEL